MQKLKADKGNNAKTYKEFHASKVKLAKDLEGRYQKKLKKGINIDITIPPLEKDKKDNDVDFKIKIAPNCVVVEESTDKFEGKGKDESELPDFSKQLEKTHPKARKFIEKEIKNINKDAKEPISDWGKMVEEVKKSQTGNMGEIVNSPLNKSSHFGNAASLIGENAVEDASKKVKINDKEFLTAKGKNEETFLSSKKDSINKKSAPFSNSKDEFVALAFDVGKMKDASNTLTGEMIELMEEVKAGKHIDSEYLAQTEELSKEEKDKLDLYTGEKKGKDGEDAGPDSDDITELKADADKRQKSREVNKEIQGHKDKVRKVDQKLTAGSLQLEKAIKDVLDAAGQIVNILERYTGKVGKDADVAGVNIDMIEGYIARAKAQQKAVQTYKTEFKALISNSSSSNKDGKGKNKKVASSPAVDSKKLNELKVDVGKAAEELRDVSNQVINKTKIYSEKIAEKFTDKVIPKLYEGAKREYPNSAEDKQGAGDVDRIFITKDGSGKLIVVEVKGGDSELGDRKVKHNKDLKGIRVQQGTIEYLMDVAQEMVASAEKGLLELSEKSKDDSEQAGANSRKQKELLKKFEVGNDIITAIRNKKIDYLLARQEFTKDGNLSTQSITRFKVKYDRIKK